MKKTHIKQPEPQPFAAPAPAHLRTQSRILEVLIEAALDAGQDIRPRAQRADGWTPERIRTFLTVLADCGVASVAAGAAGISSKSAYALRKSPKGFAFAAAWDAALRLACDSRIDPRPSSALYGSVKPILRNGKLWGFRHRHDNRAAMGALTRLDRAVGADDRALLAFEDDFDALIEIVGNGGEAAEAMIEARLHLLGHTFGETGNVGRRKNASGTTSLPPKAKACRM